MKNEIKKDLEEYILEHAKMQYTCFDLSVQCLKLGYNGFAHFFQVQAQDEFLHQRRIIKYLSERDQLFEIKSVSIEKNNCNSIIEVLETYKKHREHFAELTSKYYKNASNLDDFVTSKFYDWFLIDFYEEIAETKDLIDGLKLSNSDHYKADIKASERIAPNTDPVVDPFAPHQ
ncbi:ferritin-like domain-containing protein [Spiroplasma turonicum]|uniref:Putative ferritin n=1 Tax=Spiroplasma turonicum TaxID=216946 RepID=A0A0K1P766_9MOLU|nr:ferritin-like domain-containing protein [Spiroplasma turonicum]AKU80130.1 putative ferritin [Spiroplasma turonicum]ALX71130.1 ferritin [Spiroplasma turonicum]